MGNVLNETAMIFSDQDTVNRNKKEKEYLDYINNHISNVKKAYEMYFIPLLSKDSISDLISTQDIKNAIKVASALVQEHDASKFSDDEFDGYRIKYYPTELEKSDPNWDEYSEARSEECWEHHYRNNPHHPEHWIDKETKTPKDIPLEYIVEMFCDWEAMSMLYDDMITWYEKEGSKKEYSENTRKIIEDLLYNVLHNSKN